VLSYHYLSDRGGHTREQCNNLRVSGTSAIALYLSSNAKNVDCVLIVLKWTK